MKSTIFTALLVSGATLLSCPSTAQDRRFITTIAVEVTSLTNGDAPSYFASNGNKDVEITLPSAMDKWQCSLKERRIIGENPKMRGIVLCWHGSTTEGVGTMIDCSSSEEEINSGGFILVGRGEMFWVSLSCQTEKYMRVFKP